MHKVKKLTKDEFLEKANSAHNFKYDYSNTVYIGVSGKIIINCKNHGEFLQSARNHLFAGSGCIECKREESKIKRRNKFKDINMAEFIKVHGDRYDYSNFIYEKNSKKSEIICKKHGSFCQSANNHKSGKGCAKCSRSTMNYRKDGYVEMCREKYGSLSNIYLLKIIDNNGAVFFKIGITVQKIENRFSKSSMPYDYEVLRFIKADADAVFSAEMKIKSIVMRDRYEPLIKFSGSKYECFSTMTCGISKILDSLEVDLSA